MPVKTRVVNLSLYTLGELLYVWILGDRWEYILLSLSVYPVITICISSYHCTYIFLSLSIPFSLMYIRVLINLMDISYNLDSGMKVDISWLSLLMLFSLIYSGSEQPDGYILCTWILRCRADISCYHCSILFSFLLVIFFSVLPALKNVLLKKKIRLFMIITIYPSFSCWSQITWNIYIILEKIDIFGVV